MSRQTLYLLLAVAVVSFIFYERPSDLLSMSLPSPRHISVAVYRVSAKGQSLVASKTLSGKAAERLSGLVHRLKAVPYGKAACRVRASGHRLYTLTFRYAHSPDRIVQETPCHTWVAGSRLWRQDPALERALRSILPGGEV